MNCARCASTWPADPALAVPCPCCDAPRGSPCNRALAPRGSPVGRRSRHLIDGAAEVHAARDELAAAEVSIYGQCSADEVRDLPGQAFLPGLERPPVPPAPPIVGRAAPTRVRVLDLFGG